jgi:hypothetical protein
MRKLVVILVTLIFTFLLSGCAYRVLQTDKFLERNEMGKAKKRIDKAIEKNPEDLATQFMLAKYYSDSVWSFDAVDSARIYIHAVKDSFPKLEIKKQKKLEKRGLDSLAILKLSLRIDSLAFEKALFSNTEQAYNQYLTDYEELIYEERAIALRNQVAYDDAITENTPQAVSDFFKKYPDAPQAQKARNVFEALYYEKETQGKALSDYVAYLEERPDTEYAEDAANKILNILSAGADKSDYEQFVNKYKRYAATEKALAILKGLDYRTKQAELLTFKKDSLFYFFDLEKGQRLAFGLKGVKPDSCFFIREPFILTKQGSSKQAFLKTGRKIIDSEINSIEYIESGFFQIKDKSTKSSLIHYSLNEELKQEGLRFMALDKFHLAKKQQDGWHLISILNEPILKGAVDSIWIEENIFFVKKGNDIAVVGREDFKKTTSSDRASLSLLYNDYEWLSDDFIKLYSNDYETVLDRNAQIVFPLEKARIEYFEGFWIKEEENRFSILDQNGNPLVEERLDNYRYKSGVLAIQKDGLWSVFNDGLKGFPKFQYDSVRIFNSWLTSVINDSTEYLLFQSGLKVQLDKNETYRILKNYNVALSEVANQLRFVEISNEKGYFKLYNGFGRKIKEGEELDINVLNQQFIQIHQDKKKQLIDSAGNAIKIKNVEAFGAYENGLIPVLQGKKFGAFRVDSLKVIPAHSDNKLEVFVKDSLFIFKEKNLSGISYASGEILLEASFEAIDFFNDSTAIVEENGVIGILNIYTNEYMHKDFASWKKIFFKDSVYLMARKQAGYGVLNQSGEQVIPFIFNELRPFRTKGRLSWLAERRLSEINYMVIAYFAENGKVLFKEGVNFDDYLETACD